eukprot:TRINITY_DN18887_c0_g1_i1.p1 TRINITY_DN18887_c0_g1~~TRINITY_DN18887_c0_g1_i1.p1  ORF type:complete len:375 (+),score=117.32 TRINITY_DN18887_c0_g1_i1:61-1185(+)
MMMRAPALAFLLQGFAAVLACSEVRCPRGCVTTHRTFSERVPGGARCAAGQLELGRADVHSCHNVRPETLQVATPDVCDVHHLGWDGMADVECIADGECTFSVVADSFESACDCSALPRCSTDAGCDAGSACRPDYGNGPDGCATFGQCFPKAGEGEFCASGAAPCDEAVCADGLQCSEFGVCEPTVPAVWWPEWSTGGCLNTEKPRWEKNTAPSLEACCAKHFGWRLRKCLAAGEAGTAPAPPSTAPGAVAVAGTQLNMKDDNGRRVEAQSGSIEDGWTGRYSNGQDLSLAVVGKDCRLAFREFKLQYAWGNHGCKKNDWVRILRADGAVAKTVCGIQLPDALTVKGEGFTVEFHTDRNMGSSGFALDFACEA